MEGGHILKNKYLILKIMLLVMASTLPWFVNGGSSNDEVVKLDKNTLYQYDSLICEYSL